jgi:hypothetical protein
MNYTGSVMTYFNVGKSRNETPAASLLGRPTGPKMRLVPICSRRLSPSASYPGPFGSFEHKLDNELWHCVASMQLGNAIVG